VSGRALNRLILLTDAEGNQVQFDYDESGNQVLEEDLTRGLKTVTDHDLLNRPLSRVVSSEVDDFSYETTFKYEDASHTVIVTDPRDFKTTTEMDGFDRIHKVTQETGTEDLVTTNFYDGNGNLRETEDAKGRVTSFVYDGLNRLERIEHPLSFVTTMDYDGEGNKIEETDRRNVTTTFGYDNLGRLTGTEVVASLTGVPSITSISYDDELVQRTETDARNFATVFEMDGQERVLKITDPEDEELHL
jgi:YD repeat-containing protein